jgi:ergothioneine biosynthesis protein EgtB
MGTSQAEHLYYVKLGEVSKHFIQTRKKTEELCQQLLPEECSIGMPGVTSPPKWHLAHTSWFFERYVLRKFKTQYEPYRTEFDFLFHSYFRRPYIEHKAVNRSVLGRPSLDEILTYRHFIDETILNLLEVAGPAGHDGRIFRHVEFGIHHEEQHQELMLAEIKRMLFENPIRPAYRLQSYPRAQQREVSWRSFNQGVVKMGVPHDFEKFAYDIEKDQHKVWLEKFELSSQLVTNQEFLEFMDEGGYQNPRYWFADGWEIKEEEGWEHPFYWEKQGQNWWQMTFAGMLPLDLQAPVAYVSYYEATAFARWKKARLPTEAEWETAARLEEIKGEFLDGQRLEPVGSEGAAGLFSQIHGTLWEWTQSYLSPYPGYRPLSFGMTELNERFMCNQLVLRGGSCLLPRAHYRITSRHGEYPEQRWMPTGIRLAREEMTH